jgi:hypothetical protein
MPRSSCSKGKSHSHQRKVATRETKGRGPRRLSVVERFSPPRTAGPFSANVYDVPSQAGAPASPTARAAPPPKGEPCSTDERKHR